MNDSLILSSQFFCGLCGQLAAKVSTSPPYGHVELSGFLSTVHVGAGEKSGQQLADAVKSGEPGRLYAIDKMCAPFYCFECNKTYCKTHWEIANPHSRDVTHGWCPEKHHQLVDD